MKRSALHFNQDRLVEQFYLKDYLLQTKIIILICFFFVSLLAYGDYLNFGFSSAFYATIFARITFLLFSAVTLVILKRVKTVRQHDYLIILWCAVFISLALYVNSSRPETNINFSYIDTLIVLAIFVVFPSNIYIKSILAIILTIGDLVVISLLKSPINDISFKTIGLSYLLANVLGLFIADRLQQFRQKQYSFILQEQNLRKELEKVAFIDYLTGALNRRKFFQLGSLAFDKYKKYETSFAILMLDLDLFKNLNDKFGHAAGDNYLQNFAKSILENKRSNDIFGRLGGEEFALILPGASLESALKMAERLRRLCEEKEIYFNNQPLHTTVSIGVTKVWKKDQTFKNVLKRADDALYQAKRNGRNQIQLNIKEA